MNNKGNTMSVKQYTTHRSIFNSESFVKGLPGECAIQKLVEIRWINGIDCSRSEKVKTPRLMTRNRGKISDWRIRKDILQAEGEWIRPRLQLFFSLFSFYWYGFVSVKANAIYGLEVQLDGLRPESKRVLPPWTYDFSVHEIFESIREEE